VKLGVLGGTFDPIHVGHLRAAESAREALGLDEVLFVPARVPPHRDPPACDTLDRFAMVCLATATNPAFQVSDLELRREGPSFSVDTLTALAQARPGARLFLIVGSDAYAEMGSWRDLETVRSLCEVAVVGRPQPDATPDTSVPVLDDGAHLVEGPVLAVSATQIRERARRGQSLRYLVPEAVAHHISKRRLYR
jgi:nicotinate-nucleotide adenylyltransferase